MLCHDLAWRLEFVSMKPRVNSNQTLPPFCIYTTKIKWVASFVRQPKKLNCRRLRAYVPQLEFCSAMTANAKGCHVLLDKD